jgi:hypothetical protein
MDTLPIPKANVSAIGLVCIALMVVYPGAASSQEDKPTEDIELDFHFLHLGLSRKAVVKMFGTPNTSAESKTLMVSYSKLTWLGPDGKTFVAAFVQDRLWRWKTCSATVTDC